MEEFGADDLLRFLYIQFTQSDLSKVIQHLQAPDGFFLLAGIQHTVGKQDENGQIFDRTCHEFQQVERHRVDPVQIFQHQ